MKARRRSCGLKDNISQIRNLEGGIILIFGKTNFTWI